MDPLRKAYIFTVALLIILVAGLSIAFALVQNRHARIINEQARDVQRLEITDKAALLLAEQMAMIDALPGSPIDVTSFKDHTSQFQELIKTPLLITTPQVSEIQQRLLAAQFDFSQSALSLPNRPSIPMINEVRAKGEETFNLLNAFRAQHSVDLSTLQQSEQEQRRLSFIMVLVTNVVVTLLALIGFRLLGQLGRQQSEVAALRATDQLRQEFVAFASHELRNPASAIQTGISLLKEPDIDSEQRALVIESISRSSDALVRLIYNLLALGRVEEGQVRLNIVEVELSVLIDSLISELEVYHPGMEMRVKRTLPPATVEVDAEYVKLALANILDNAVKYATPGSDIDITGEVKGDTVITRIHNFGKSISPEELPYIFEKYETSGAAPNTLRRGIGLGLYMARLLIEAHGGSISAQSGPQEGTTFSVALPLAKNGVPRSRANSS